MWSFIIKSVGSKYHVKTYRIGANLSLKNMNIFMVVFLLCTMKIYTNIKRMQFSTFKEQKK